MTLPRRGSDRQGSFTMFAVLVLVGGIAISLFLATDHLHRLQHTNALRSDLLMDMQIHLAEGHLAMEEYLDGDIAEPGIVSDYFEKTARLADVLMKGGVNEQGLAIESLRDPNLFEKSERLKSEITSLAEEVQGRMTLKGREETEEDAERHDVSFRTVLEDTRYLEHYIEEEVARRKAQFDHLFRGILAFWAAVVAAAAVVLHRVEKRRRQAETKLVEANTTLEQQAGALERHRRELASKVAARTEELSAANMALHRLSSQMLDAQETERRRICMELHDDLGQALNVIKLRVREVWKGMREDQEELKDESLGTMELIDETIENVRNISLDLSPAVIEKFGLAASLEMLCRRFATQPCPLVRCRVADGVDSLVPEEKRIVVYRIIQEALTNASRHAGASSIVIESVLDKGNLTFRVRDDGKGFDPTASQAEEPGSGRLGLTTMRERARLISGEFQLASSIGEGTTVAVRISVGMKS